MELLTTITLWQSLFLLLCIGLAFILYQCLPFRYRRRTGLVQLALIAALGYGIFYGAGVLMTEENLDALVVIKQPDYVMSENWQPMVVRRQLHLRSCASTYCESLALLKIGNVVEAELNHTEGDWAAARYQGKSGFISTLWAERYVPAQ